MSEPSDARVARGPYFEELARGDIFDGSPAVTLTDGLAAVHAAIVGDRLPLALDADLSHAVTGESQPLAHPALSWDIAIGQSTGVTQNVVANLFYRRLAFRRMPHVGDTLRTVSEVVALRQNTRRGGRQSTGLVVLRITTTDQRDRQVLDFWRCAMLPLADTDLDTGHRDDVRVVGTELDETDLVASLVGWRLGRLSSCRPRSSLAASTVGDKWTVTGGDVVSSAPELARLTLNVAAVHHDEISSSQGRLVYGGHTIGLALAQAARAVPGLVTVTAWQSCDHLGPVREGDTLHSTIEVGNERALSHGCRLTHLRSIVTARSDGSDSSRPVLDWRYVGLVA